MPGGYDYCSITSSVGPFAPQAQGSILLECQTGDVLEGTTFNIIDVATGNIVGNDSGGYPLYWYSFNSVTDPVTGVAYGASGSFRNNGTLTVRVDFVAKCRDA